MNLFHRKILPRYVRLLPGVVLVGASLLVLKTSDLVRDAYAEATNPAAIATDPVPANPDYAGGQEDEVASASQVDVLGALARRNRELDKREQVLTGQARMIAAAESRVDTKIAQLKQLQTQIATLLGQRDQAQKTQITNLVKTYSAMKPADAARIFNSLEDGVLVPVAQQMKSDVLGAVLAKMNADAAQRLTVKLADRLTLPATTDAPAPTPAPTPTPAAPAPAPAASAAAPVPVAQASSAPPAAAAKPAEKPAAPKT